MEGGLHGGRTTAKSRHKVPRSKEIPNLEAEILSKQHIVHAVNKLHSLPKNTNKGHEAPEGGVFIAFSPPLSSAHTPSNLI